MQTTRRALILGATIRAFAIGVAAGLAIVATVVLVDSVRALPRSVRELVMPISLTAAIITAGAVLWRYRFTGSMRRVARWVEEREPRLEFALLTALDDTTPATARAAVEAAVHAVRWESVVADRVRRAVVMPLATIAILGVLLVLSPSASRARVATPTPGDALSGRGAGESDDPDPLSPLVVVVTPPSYAGRGPVTLDDPSTIVGLVGSTVTLRGRLGAATPTVSVANEGIDVATSAQRWSATVRMPNAPAAIRLSDRRGERLIVVEPQADSVPVVALTHPTADTVFTAPSGAMDLAATLRDDIGIVTGGVEYIVSSGSGESFTFRSGTLARVAGGGRTRVELTLRLVLDSLRLAAGDVVHLRAFARDANSVTGPSIGYSETRTLRIARPDERDSVAVDAAPPQEVDGSLISQRMLIVLTEALQARRSRLARPALVSESRRLAADQKKLRRTVGDIIFTRLGADPSAEHVHGPGDVHEAGDLTPAEMLKAAERANAASRAEVLDFHGDETPVVAINRPLLEAYNHMWDASRELDVGEPGRALPPMRAALAAIQRARQAERIYLRGRAAPVIVDIAAVRLQGREKGAGSQRSARTPVESRREIERFTRAVGLLDSAPQQAIDSLLLLRIDLLATRAAAARTLGESIDLLRAGRDATGALGRARRTLVGEPASAQGLGRWSGGW